MVYLPYLHSSSQIFNRSSKNLFFSSSFIPYFLVSGQSVIPAHSPDLQAFPLFSYLYGSSQIFNRSSKTFLLLSSFSSWYLDSRSFRPTLQIPKFFISSLFPTVRNRSSTGLPTISPLPSPTTWYLDSWSFRPTLQFSKSLHFLSYPYTSSQIFHRSSKKFFFLHPLLLSFWTVGHSGPLSSFPVPLFYSSFSPFIFIHLPLILLTFFSLHPLYPGTRTVCHSTNFPKMEDPHQIPHQTPMTTPVENNLVRINTAFQDSCMPLLLTTNHSCMILCDFPSRILNPPPNISIFSLDDFPLFLNTAIAHPERCVYVLTQQTLTLRKLLSLPSPLPMPFWFLTRTSSTAPLELKIIEIFHSLPIGLQDRISQLYFICTFSAMLKGKKGPWLKQFDLFHLLLDPCNLSSFIQIPSPPPFYRVLCIANKKTLLLKPHKNLFVSISLIPFKIFFKLNSLMIWNVFATKSPYLVMLSLIQSLLPYLPSLILNHSISPLFCRQSIHPLKMLLLVSYLLLRSNPTSLPFLNFLNSAI